LSGLLDLNPHFSLAKTALRRLFLDDDPDRASAFLEAHPDAVWVQTVPECVEKLAESWDEVHLDHDLGGEHFVQVDRDDCGMEVVRWLILAPRKHLRRTRFTIHSHNIAAAFEMAMRLQAVGFWVEARPFGVELTEGEPFPPTGLARFKQSARTLIRRIMGLDPLDKPETVDADSTDHAS
jgi:hypothetical protein